MDLVGGVEDRAHDVERGVLGRPDVEHPDPDPLTDLPPAVNVAALQVIGVGAFLLTPPLIGGVAELAGLRVGIAVVLPMIVVSFVLARELTRKVAPATTMNEGKER